MPVIPCILCRTDCTVEHFECTRATDHAKRVNMPVPTWCPVCFATTDCGRGDDKFHGPGCRTKVVHSRWPTMPGHDVQPQRSKGFLAFPRVQVAEELVRERERYLVFQSKECTTKSDDTFTKGELARQAASYAMWASGHDYLFAAISTQAHGPASNCGHVSASVVLWPFNSKTHIGPSISLDGKVLSHREALVRAGALIIGEIERLDRAEAAALKASKP